MVGVIRDPNSDDVLTANKELIKCLLKEREMHAKQQQYDYSHVFRRKTNWEMFRLSSIAMAMELVYAAETSFVSPILLKTGIDHKHMTMAWGLSPLIGFFLSPLLGSISDRCHLKWGRRRPIITMLALGISIGLALVPYGRDLGALLGDRTYSINETLSYSSNSTETEAIGEAHMTSFNYKYAAILTILGTVLLDFDADTCQTPARTYLLDMCTPEDQPRALTMFTLFAGVGGTIGYAIGGIDWESTQLSNLLGDNIQTVFGLVAIIFVICYLITVTTFREIPLRLLESDEMLRPLSEQVIRREIAKKKSNTFYIDKINSLDITIKINNNNNNNINSNTSSIIMNSTNFPNAINLVDVGGDRSPNKNGDLKLKEMENDTKCLNNSPVTLKQYLKSIFVMPYSMKILALTNLICWMGHITYCLYFTDFVGEAVFHGNPVADHRSASGQLYEAGIRFGCWGMSIYALSCSIYSLSVTKLMKWFGLKTVYIGGIAFYGVGMLVLGIWPTKWGVLVISTTAGVLYGTIFTMPFILVARYHNQNCFIVSKGITQPLKQTRGLGTDIAIISSMVFIAQFIVSLCMGTVVAWMQTTSAILYASALFSFLAIISAMFILYI